MVSYFKLINGQNIVGVASLENLRKFQRKHNVYLLCDLDHAEYVEYNGIYYHDDWLRPVMEDQNYVRASIVSIDKDEYDALVSAFETESEIEIDDDEVVIEDVVDDYFIDSSDPANEATIEFLKTAKLNEMSVACNRAITNGFDVTLADGESHHFSLTVQDQLNLITLSSMVAAGEPQVPYHADGELCRYFSADEMQAIIDVAANKKTYLTTYFNSLKAYIESLETVDEIVAVTFGMDIPAAFQSDIFKHMLEANAE